MYLQVSHFENFILHWDLAQPFHHFCIDIDDKAAKKITTMAKEVKVCSFCLRYQYIGEYSYLAIRIMKMYMQFSYFCSLHVKENQKLSKILVIDGSDVIIIHFQNQVLQGRSRFVEHASGSIQLHRMWGFPVSRIPACLYMNSYVEGLPRQLRSIAIILYSQNL